MPRASSLRWAAPASRVAALLSGGVKAVWDELEHPRGPDGRFIKKWGMPKATARSIGNFLWQSDPKTFGSNQQAGQWAFNMHHKSPGLKNWNQEEFVADWQPANDALRAGEMDPSTQDYVSMMDENMQPLDQTISVQMALPPEAFGLTADDLVRRPQAAEAGDEPHMLSGVDLLTGRVLADRGYVTTTVGDPVRSTDGAPGTADPSRPILMAVMVPKGTKVAFPGQDASDRRVVLDRDQDLRITRVEAAGNGYYVYAVAVPKGGGGQTPEPLDADATRRSARSISEGVYQPNLDILEREKSGKFVGGERGRRLQRIARRYGIDASGSDDEIKARFVRAAQAERAARDAGEAPNSTRPIPEAPSDRTSAVPGFDPARPQESLQEVRDQRAAQAPQAPAAPAPQQQQAGGPAPRVNEPLARPSGGRQAPAAQPSAPAAPRPDRTPEEGARVWEEVLNEWVPPGDTELRSKTSKLQQSLRRGQITPQQALQSLQADIDDLDLDIEDNAGDVRGNLRRSRDRDRLNNLADRIAERLGVARQNQRDENAPPTEVAPEAPATGGEAVRQEFRRGVQERAEARAAETRTPGRPEAGSAAEFREGVQQRAEKRSANQPRPQREEVPPPEQLREEVQRRAEARAQRPEGGGESARERALRQMRERQASAPEGETPEQRARRVSDLQDEELAKVGLRRLTPQEIAEERGEELPDEEGEEGAPKKGLAKGRKRTKDLVEGDQILAIKGKDGTWKTTTRKSGPGVGRILVQSTETYDEESPKTGRKLKRVAVTGQDEQGNKVEIRGLTNTSSFWDAATPESRQGVKKGAEKSDLDTTKAGLLEIAEKEGVPHKKTMVKADLQQAIRTHRRQKEEGVLPEAAPEAPKPAKKAAKKAAPSAGDNSLSRDELLAVSVISRVSQGKESGWFRPSDVPESARPHLDSLVEKGALQKHSIRGDEQFRIDPRGWAGRKPQGDVLEGDVLPKPLEGEGRKPLHSLNRGAIINGYRNRDGTFGNVPSTGADPSRIVRVRIQRKDLVNEEGKRVPGLINQTHARIVGHDVATGRRIESEIVPNGSSWNWEANPVDDTSPDIEGELAVPKKAVKATPNISEGAPGLEGDLGTEEAQKVLRERVKARQAKIAQEATPEQEAALAERIAKRREAGTSGTTTGARAEGFKAEQARQRAAAEAREAGVEEPTSISLAKPTPRQVETMTEVGEKYRRIKAEAPNDDGWVSEADLTSPASAKSAAAKGLLEVMEVPGPRGGVRRQYRPQGLPPAVGAVDVPPVKKAAPAKKAAAPKPAKAVEIPKASRAVEPMNPGRVRELEAAWDQQRFDIPDATSAGSLDEVRSDLATGKITPDEAVRRIETDIDFNTDESRELDLEDRRNGNKANAARIRELGKAVSEQKRASTFLRRHFEQEPGITDAEVDNVVEAAVAAGDMRQEDLNVLDRATPDEVADTREKLKSLGIKAEGDTGFELFKSAARDIIERRLRGEEIPDLTPLVKPKERRPGVEYVTPQARDIADGLDIPDLLAEKIQADLDNPKKTPAKVGRDLETFIQSPVGPRGQAAVVRRHAERVSPPDPKMLAEADRLDADADELQKLADRLKATKRKRATAAKPEPVKLDAADRKEAARVADLAGVPESKVEKRMLESKEDSQPISDHARGTVDLLRTTTSEDEARKLLASKAKTRQDLVDVAKAADVEVPSRATKAQLTDAIVRRTTTGRLEHEAYLRRATPVTDTGPEGPGADSMSALARSEGLDSPEDERLAKYLQNKLDGKNTTLLGRDIGRPLTREEVAVEIDDAVDNMFTGLLSHRGDDVEANIAIRKRSERWKAVAKKLRGGKAPLHSGPEAQREADARAGIPSGRAAPRAARPTTASTGLTQLKPGDVFFNDPSATRPKVGAPRITVTEIKHVGSQRSGARRTTNMYQIHGVDEEGKKVVVGGERGYAPGTRFAKVVEAPGEGGAPEAPKAAELPKRTPSEIESHLDDLGRNAPPATAGDDARKYIDDLKLSLPEMKQLAKDLDVPTTSRSKATIRDDIVRVHVEGKTTTRAIGEVFREPRAELPKRTPGGAPMGPAAEVRRKQFRAARGDVRQHGFTQITADNLSSAENDFAAGKPREEIARRLLAAARMVRGFTGHSRVTWAGEVPPSPNEKRARFSQDADALERVAEFLAPSGKAGRADIDTAGERIAAREAEKAAKAPAKKVAKAAPRESLPAAEADILRMSIPELRALAKARNVKGWDTLGKDALLDRLLG